MHFGGLGISASGSVCSIVEVGVLGRRREVIVEVPSGMELEVPIGDIGMLFILVNVRDLRQSKTEFTCSCHFHFT